MIVNNNNAINKKMNTTIKSYAIKEIFKDNKPEIIFDPKSNYSPEVITVDREKTKYPV